MPLWYLISGYFFMQKPIAKSTVKDSKTLVAPYFITGAIICLFILIIWGGQKACLYLKIMFLGAHMSNSLNVSIGPLWFLISLFLCKTIYNILSYKLNNKDIFVISVILSTVYVCVSLFFSIIIPFYLPTVVYGLIFFSLGVQWKNSNKRVFATIKRPLLSSCIVCGLLTCFQLQCDTFNMSVSNFTFYPFCILSSYTYIYLLYRLSIYIDDKHKSKNSTKAMIFIGQHTLDILLFHSVEFCISMPLISLYIQSFQFPWFINYTLYIINMLVQLMLAILYAYCIYWKKNCKKATI